MWKLHKTIGLAAVAAFIWGLGLEPASGAKLSLGYIYNGDTRSLAGQVDDTRQSVNRVSPALFGLTLQGGLELAPDTGVLVQELKKRNVKIVPFLGNDWDRERGQNALKNREALTSAIAGAVTKFGLDGVNADIENLTEGDRDAYTDLVRLLRQKLPPSAEVSVAVPANPDGWNTGWMASFDMKKLVLYCDYLMLMAYEENWGGDPTSGPVAGLPWVERSVRQALNQVPPSKLLLGIPFYGRYWSLDGTVNGAAISNKEAEALAERYGITPMYDENVQSPFFTVTVEPADEALVINYRKLEPGTYTVWFDNERSIKKKLELVSRYQLLGAGSWSLGQEAPETWSYYPLWLNGHYYSDMAGHWAEAEIKEASLNGWMQGTASGAFAPDGSLTRAQAAVILARVLDLKNRQTAPAVPASAGAEGADAPFADVPATYWGRTEIELARRFGLTDGISSGVFAPERPVTREEMSAMLARALDTGKPVSGAAGGFPGFADVPAARWSYAAVGSMQRMGLLQGYADGTFRPARTMTRAEAAVLLCRAAPLLP